MTERREEIGFCPFCNSKFDGDVDICPNCGQDIRQYKDDLGPVLDKIQTVTNIDMKSTKARVGMCILIFILVFAGALVIMDSYDRHHTEPDPEPVPEGIIVNVTGYGYMDLTGDFASGRMNVIPLYNPDLRLSISLANDLGDRYYRIMWVVETESYNADNPKNPFYMKVTKDRSGSSSIDTVTWENVNVGRFTITADCYTESGECDVFIGNGTFYGSYSTTYEWTYDGRAYSIKYTMSSDDVRTCLNYNLRDRTDMQTTAPMTDFVVGGKAISDLDERLMSAYKRYHDFSPESYADFVLSFVQQCFPFEYDSFNYKVEDYWAYPTETILWGCGDDEDRAILYCAIMEDSESITNEEIGTALIQLPETTIAGITSDEPIPKGMRFIMYADEGYIVADTGSDLQLGKIRDIYSISDDGTTVYYNGEELHDRIVFPVGKISNT